MALKKLVLDHVRNIEHAILEPDPRLNIIYGANASGKTSLLEGIHLLGTARSFRTARVNHTIQRTEPCLTVSGKLATQPEVNIGVERCKDKTRIRINQKNISQASELVRQLPMQIITPESHEILDQGPKHRRQLIDWGMFHVKPQYLDHIKAFMRALRQRNAALRKDNNPMLVRSFDAGLVHAAQAVHNKRSAYIADIGPRIIDMTKKLCGETITVHYQSGWKAGENYQDVLKNQYDSDSLKHHTQSGPHRADLIFKVDSVPVQQGFSRGQQKMLVCALKLAQLQYYFDKTCRSALVLVDDLAAELDITHRQRLLELLMVSQAQIFITLTEKDLLDASHISSKKVFHVKQGAVKQD